MSDKIAAKITKAFGHRTRIRVCGLLFIDKEILLIKHKGLGSKGEFWSPPGGEPNFGEDLDKTLKREFYEETGLLVENKGFLFINEHISDTLHAIELFYLVDKKGGTLTIGTEPEMGNENIIQEIKFFSESDLKRLEKEKLHSIFKRFNSFGEIQNFYGILS